MNSKSTIQEKYNLASIENNLEAIQDIILELNAMSPEEKKKLKDLYTQIGIDLFDNNIKLRNYDLAAYEKDIVIKPHDRDPRKSKKKKDSPAESFDDIFCEYYKNSQDIFPDLKYHFLFQLPSRLSASTSLLIISDDKFSDNPLLARIITNNLKINPQKFTVQEFLDLILKRSDILDNQYIVLLAISPTVGSNTVFNTIRELFSKLENLSIIAPEKACDINVGDYSYHKVDAVLIDKIEKITTNFLNNKAISHEEEKVIKLLLPKNTPITDYTILKSGFSGSKVIQVQSVRDMPGSEPIRYVIKFSNKTGERKIYYEKEVFREYLQQLKVQGYTCDYEATEQCEGISYNYASADSRKDSHSFASLLADYLSTKQKISHDLINTLEELFNCAPFKKWTGLTPINQPVKQIYSKYLDERKVLNSISLIKNKSVPEIESSDLFNQYKKIISYSLETNQKICHGDLHTENFFKDDDDVYLIDFGYTGKNHALLDHTTLEASIKFKHIPFYIPLEEILPIEIRLFEKSSFKEGYDLSFINRPSLKKLFEIIVKIRTESVKHFRYINDPLEYLISLFVISFRQIQYKDLNQRYAFEYTKILGEHISTILKKSTTKK